MKRITIAIDGHSSCGKSTMAKELARRVGYVYVDTGAMYRAVTLYALRHNLFAADGTVLEEPLREAMPQITVDQRLVDGKTTTFLNGENVELEIRGLEVSNHVSPIAAIPFVRTALVAQQQKMGREGGIVMDGRDIGTTVFPNAELKIFVTASAEVRAQRRYDELQQKGMPADYADILKNVQERDYIDSHRDVSPLRQADDALLLDNSHMTIEEQNAWLMEKFQNAGKWHLGDIIFVPRTTRVLKKSKKSVYKRIVDLQYICVREATENQCGILLRVLGKTKASSIETVCGEPFYADESFSLLEGMEYQGYSFPTTSQLTEVLGIVHDNPSLLSKFHAASMPFDPQSLFWVYDSSLSLGSLKNLQCYDATSGNLCKAPTGVSPIRLTMVYFNTQQEYIELDTDNSIAKRLSGRWGKTGAFLLCAGLVAAGAFLANKYIFNTNEAPMPVKAEKKTVTSPAAAAPLETADSLKQQADSVASSKQQADSVASSKQQADTVASSKQQSDSVTSDKYEEMDIRVRTGAYRIIGTDHVVKVKPGDNMTRISNRTLGPGMECYIEVYNGIKQGAQLKTDQEIKIPKVELKKKKQ